MELFEFFCQIAFNKFELVQAQKKHFIGAPGARPAAAWPAAAAFYIAFIEFAKKRI